MLYVILGVGCLIRGERKRACLVYCRGERGDKVISAVFLFSCAGEDVEQTSDRPSSDMKDECRVSFCGGGGGGGRMVRFFATASVLSETIFSFKTEPKVVEKMCGLERSPEVII
jgi:hypothetical protein